MADEPPFISPPFRESTSDFVRRIASEPRPADGPPINCVDCAAGRHERAWPDSDRCSCCGADLRDDDVPFPENRNYGCVNCGSVNHTTGDKDWCPKERWPDGK
jgi:hypothetical protein